MDRRLLVLLMLLLSMGCAIGPMGLTIGYTVYEHMETLPIESEFEGADTHIAWRTQIWRPWGTSDSEWFINQKSERGSSGGEGISDNMRAVIGDDALQKVAKAVVAGVNPASGGGAALGAIVEGMGDDEVTSEIVPEGESEAPEPSMTPAEISDVIKAMMAAETEEPEEPEEP